eukprot:jgi/Galph1/6123/GphlegSOOS_G4696.1
MDGCSLVVISSHYVGRDVETGFKEFNSWWSQEKKSLIE